MEQVNDLFFANLAINYNTKNNQKLENIVKKILSDRLKSAKYINRPIKKREILKIKLSAINEYTEFIILNDKEFTKLIEELENDQPKE